MTQPTVGTPSSNAPGFDALISQQTPPLLLPPGPDGFERRPRGAQRARGQVDTRSLAVPVVVIVLVSALLGGGALVGLTLVQMSEAEVRADSAAMCADLAQTPGVLERPGFGWPTDGADLTSTVSLMRDYRDRWAALASQAAPTIRPDVAAVAAAASSIINGIEISESIDRPASLSQMNTVTSSTAIPAWVDKYCD